ncbi:MAG: hypothetical protein Q7S07_05900 [Candidatus Omnitrophota bacterium]|nr:hypothetical protein [Candidatus Omnitrophota bacterium]
MKRDNMKTGRGIDFERETRVLLENMQAGIKIVAEGHTGIIGGLESVKSRLDGVESKLDRVENRLGTVESELHTVKMVVFDLDSRLTKVESKLSVVENKIDISLEQNDGRFRQIEKKLALA